MPPPDFKSAIIGILSAILVVPIAALAGLVIGRFKIGFLEKSIVMTLRLSALPSFLETFRARLASIGFEEDPDSEQFFQGRSNCEVHTHATKKKVLNLAIVESGGPDATVKITIRYLDFIIGDTGESAYRNAIFNYVSGKADSMVVVPNNSLEAFVTLISGIIACLAYGFLAEEKRAELWFAITIFTGTNVGLGLHALQSIKEHAKELKGKGQAIMGVMFCLATGLATVVPLVINKISEFLKQLGVD